LEKLTVFGSDYDTPDGTGIRDYIHVCDLANGHVAVLSALKAGSVIDYNLGTGRGYTVLEIVRAFEAANGIEIPYVFGPRRPGDIAAYWSDPSKIERELGWKAEKDLEDMCRDSWNWQKKNPEGYGR
ncbi:MAG: GDP-mannose 4,6-dehydratase, partial [Firmicutes bacterium]|nr:GDP-mannose 4,6-dehydratase [Bacillota bacterium]